MSKPITIKDKIQGILEDFGDTAVDIQAESANSVEYLADNKVAVQEYTDQIIELIKDEVIGKDKETDHQMSHRQGKAKQRAKLEEQR